MDYLETARKVYLNADKHDKELLLSIFGSELLPVNNLDDAVRVLGNEHPYVQAYHILSSSYNEVLKSTVAELELKIICTALNGGSLPRPGEDGYIPIFEIRDNELANYPSYPTLDGRHLVYLYFFKCTKELYSNIRLKTPELADMCAAQFIRFWGRYYGVTD